jgi:putative aldouronate transport system permease protein
MLFSGGLVPLYLLVTQYLKLQNSYFAVILPLLVAPFLVFIQVSAVRQLPEEILDSARVDGAGELAIFFRIGLPLSKPILAVVGLFYAVHYWNEWFTALLFMSDVHKYPLPLLLQNLISNVSFSQMLPTAAQQTTPVYQLRLALTVVTIGPILLAYPFAQRYFVKGITLGATKGRPTIIRRHRARHISRRPQQARLLGRRRRPVPRGRVRTQRLRWIVDRRFRQVRRHPRAAAAR